MQHLDVPAAPGTPEESTRTLGELLESYTMTRVESFYTGLKNIPGRVAASKRAKRRLDKQNAAVAKVPHTPPPGLSRDDKFAGLSGKFGAASRVLRSGARVKCIATTWYAAEDAMGFVWRTSSAKAMVRMDREKRNIVLPVAAFCVEEPDGSLRPAASAGGFIRPEIPLTEAPTRYIFKLVPVGRGDHVIDKAGFLETAFTPAPPRASPRRGHNALNTHLSSTAATQELLSLFAVPRVLPRHAVAGDAAVAAALITTLPGLWALLSRPLDSYHVVAVRPDPTLHPAHTIFLSKIVELLGGTVVAPFAALPQASREAHATVVLFSPTAEVHAWVLREATERYASVFVVVDSAVPQLPRRGRGGRGRVEIPVVHVASGAAAVWDVLNALHLGHVDPAEFSKTRDPWQRKVLIPRPARKTSGGAAAAASRPAGGIITSLLRTREVILTVTTPYAADPHGQSLTAFAAKWPPHAAARTICTIHGFVVGATPAECMRARAAIARHISTVLSYRSAYVPEEAVCFVPMVHAHGAPRTVVAVARDLCILFRSFQDGLVTSVVGLPLLDVVLIAAVCLTLSPKSPPDATNLLSDYCARCISGARDPASHVTYVSFEAGTNVGGAAAETAPSPRTEAIFLKSEIA